MNIPTHRGEEEKRRQLLREYFENACIIIALQKMARMAATEARQSAVGA